MQFVRENLNTLAGCLEHGILMGSHQRDD